MEVVLQKKQNHHLKISILLHVGLVLLFVAIHFVGFNNKTKNSDVVEISVNSKTVDSRLNLQPQQVKEVKPEVEKQGRKVFGVSRKSILADSNTKSLSAEVKSGNTVAKENDNLKLDSHDADSLPIPVEDYLVTTQPKRLHEEKVQRTEESLRADVDGPVLVDILIDETGRVRDVQIIQGPGYGLNEAVKKAMYKFLFSPALVNGKPVAKKFRYTYRFRSEN